MKKTWFDGRLYLQGLKRLRLIGLAMAILFITVAVLVPLTTWIQTANQMQYVDEYYDSMYDPMYDSMYGEEDPFSEPKIKAVENRRLIIPVLVASYLAPVFILLIFSYLNRRSESDFYHAIPYTRVCVYTSFVAAAMTWMLAILIVSSLAAGLFWTLCPYTTYSFGGLIGEMLLCCLNAAFLASFATVGVSLMGTPMTGIIAMLLSLCSWRVIVCFAYLSMEDILRIAPVDEIWGGYLTPNWILPVALVSEKETTASIVYAAIVALVIFAVGGLLYHLRRSETAGRSVPGRLLQIVCRLLITLPSALCLTYMIIGGTEFTSLLILLVVTLLVFYLYELLTTKSARSMMRATPWLGVLVLACLIFTGAVFAGKAVICKEEIGADRIREIGITNASIRGYEELAISDYERFLMSEYMSDDPTAIRLAAKALRDSQEADWNDEFYQTKGGWDDSFTKYTEYVLFSVRIKLNGGRTITRYIRMPKQDYIVFLNALKTDLSLNSLPMADEVDYFQVAQYGYSCVQTLEEAWIERVLEAMRQDHAQMSEQEKNDMVSYGGERVQFSLRIQIKENFFFCNYYLTDAMPHTAAVICELYLGKQAEAKAMVSTVIEEARNRFGEGHEGNLTIGFQKNIMQPEARYYDVIEGKAEALLDFLAEHINDPVDEARASDCVALWIEAFYDFTDADGGYVYKSYSLPVPIFLDLTREEYEELILVFSKN